MTSDAYTKALNSIYTRLLSFLAVKPRSEGEIGKKLQSYLAPIQSLSAAEKKELQVELTTKLKADKLINDKQYVQEYLRQIADSPKAHSVLHLKKFLYTKNIPSSIVDQEVANLGVGFELEKAKAAAIKKAKSLSKLPFFEKKKKVYAYLASKGFSGSTISSIIDSALDVK